MTCEHCEATLAFIAKNAAPQAHPSFSWPVVGGGARYPTWPAAEIAACPCRCHEAWKLTNRYPL